jgi:hypothetical protein
MCLVWGTFTGLFVAPAEEHMQSTVSTVSRDFLIPLMVNFAGMLLLVIALMTLGTRTAAMRLEDEMAPPMVEVTA